MRKRVLSGQLIQSQLEHTVKKKIMVLNQNLESSPQLEVKSDDDF